MVEEQLASILRGVNTQLPFQGNCLGQGRNFFGQTTDMATGTCSTASLPGFFIKQNMDRNLKLGTSKKNTQTLFKQNTKNLNFSNWRKDLILLVGEMEATRIYRARKLADLSPVPLADDLKENTYKNWAEKNKAKPKFLQHTHLFNTCHLNLKV